MIFRISSEDGGIRLEFRAFQASPHISYTSPIAWGWFLFRKTLQQQNSRKLASTVCCTVYALKNLP